MTGFGAPARTYGTLAPILEGLMGLRLVSVRRNILSHSRGVRRKQGLVHSFGLIRGNGAGRLGG